MAIMSACLIKGLILEEASCRSDQASTHDEAGTS